MYFSGLPRGQDAISQSLQEYGAHLVALKREMEEATGAADALRRDIADLRHKAIVVQAGDTCDICQGQVHPLSHLANRYRASVMEHDRFWNSC